MLDEAPRERWGASRSATCRRESPRARQGSADDLSLCSIHHRAFEHDLVGIDPDYTVRISRRLLDDEDGPMLELLKGFHDQPLVGPRAAELQPDRECLAERYDRFLARAG